MLGAFVSGDRFPIPGLLTCSVGATCDDFSAIAQRLESLGFPILWWEMPHRRRPDRTKRPSSCPADFAPRPSRSPWCKSELERVRQAWKRMPGSR